MKGQPMKTESMIDTSTPEKHLDSLTMIMITMGIAGREDLVMKAWNQACDLVNNDKAKMREVEKRIIKFIAGHDIAITKKKKN